MVSASQIREQLAAVLDGKIDIEEFEDWFVQNTWNVHQGGSVAAEDLTFSVEESLSEYSSRHINERDLRHELSGILHTGTKVVDVVDVPQIIYKYSFKPSAAPMFVPVKL